MDWNPSGMLIYSVYKYGSGARRQGLAAQHTLPGLQLLAVRAEMLQGVPQHVVQVRALPTTLGCHARGRVLRMHMTLPWRAD